VLASASMRLRPPPNATVEMVAAWVDAMAAIGELLRTYRVAADMPVERLADAIGVDRSTVAGWETGHSVPRLGNLVMVLLVLPEMAHALADRIDATRERHHVAA
jgi:DNA-binding XRE family transcriptional regulator